MATSTSATPVTFLAGTRWASGGFGRLICVRLAPGEDLKGALEAITVAEGIEHALILGGAASLRRCVVRNVGVAPKQWPITDAQRVWTSIEGPLELVSIMGNISRWPDGRPYTHAHVIVSKGSPAGECFGGHLVDGAEILTTGELALAEVTGVRLRRDRDPDTLGEELFPDPLRANG
ncbi:MAG: DNA-binding protein [Armatimonadetes bacterium]|nr:DNA-binding protein [Armatimonadota bacterium]